MTTKSNSLLSKNLENSIFATTIPRVPWPVDNQRKRRKIQDENPPLPITFANISKENYYANSEGQNQLRF